MMLRTLQAFEHVANAVLHRVGWDLYADLWGSNEWGLERTERGDFLAFIGPVHLAVSRL